MQINQEALETFNQLEIIVHCLYEMTYYGFSEDEIQRVITKVEGTIDNLKKNND